MRKQLDNPGLTAKEGKWNLMSVLSAGKESTRLNQGSGSIYLIMGVCIRIMRNRLLGQ